jgi:hypothetical protein
MSGVLHIHVKGMVTVSKDLLNDETAFKDTVGTEVLRLLQRNLADGTGDAVVVHVELHPPEVVDVELFTKKFTR